MFLLRTSLLKQLSEFPVRVESHGIVAASDVLSSDEDVRYGSLSRHVLESRLNFALFVHLVDLDHGGRDVERCEQAFDLRAEWAVGFRVDDDGVFCVFRGDELLDFVAG